MDSLFFFSVTYQKILSYTVLRSDIKNKSLKTNFKNKLNKTKYTTSLTIIVISTEEVKGRAIATGRKN